MFPNVKMCCSWIVTVAAAVLTMLVGVVQAIHWDHSAQLLGDATNDFRLLWNVRSDEISFEIQVRTHGYVGFGFAREAATLDGADMVIGWVDGRQTYFQDRHIKTVGDGEPTVDPSQDYMLLLGYENRTHTVMRFKRKLNTCDADHDVAITNDTMRLVIMYHHDEPRFGSVTPGSLPEPNVAFRGVVPLQLTQRTATSFTDGATSSSIVAGIPANNSKVREIELRNRDVPLPQNDEEPLQWCRVIELKEFAQKHHMIRYEPIFDAAESRIQLDYIALYECHGSSVRLAAMAAAGGRTCENHRHNPALPCNAIVASWTRGSEGLTFPPEAGYPFDSNKERFYLMETHYTGSNIGSTSSANDAGVPTDLGATGGALHHQQQQRNDDDGGGVAPRLDGSGLKLYVTPELRKYDAGVLSIGMKPDWRHIIPPGQSTVISEGRCVDECTRRAFPPAGISIFAVTMQTHGIGKRVRLRQVRQDEELVPIAEDAGIQAGYSEYRGISPPAKVQPGDSLVVECSYDSSGRDSITLGGTSTRGESCNVLAVYYPRQRRMTTCQSLPSLTTVLHSLGINELSVGSQPVLIANPPELAGMTLESRLLSYDWAAQFHSFQRITHSGSFQATCTDARSKTLSGTANTSHYRPAITRTRTPPPQTTPCSTSTIGGHNATADDIDSNTIDVSEYVTKRRHIDDSAAAVESLYLSGSTHLSPATTTTVTTSAIFAIVAGQLLMSRSSFLIAS